MAEITTEKQPLSSEVRLMNEQTTRFLVELLLTNGVDDKNGEYRECLAIDDPNNTRGVLYVAAAIPFMEEDSINSISEPIEARVREAWRTPCAETDYSILTVHAADTGKGLELDGEPVTNINVARGIAGTLMITALRHGLTLNP